MSKGSAIIWPATVTVRIGKPIRTVGRTIADRDEVSQQVRAAVQALLDTAEDETATSL
jgi:hypothetical protein